MQPTAPRSPHHTALLALAALSSGCIIIDDLPADFAAPDCMAGQLVVEGAIGKDGEHKMPPGAQPVASASFMPPAADAPGSLTIQLGNGDAVSLFWQEPLADGPVQASGVANFTATNETHFGNCAEDRFPGGLRVDPDGERFEFHIDRVRERASCEEDVERGDIVGCFAPAEALDDGTLEAPLMSDGDAAVVELSATRTDLDFGLGRLE